MKVTRREFLESTPAAAVVTQTVRTPGPGIAAQDGPQTSRFVPLPLQGNLAPADLTKAGLSEELTKAADRALSGSCVCWGIPFQVNKLILLKDQPVTEKIPATRAQWLVFMHTTDTEPWETNKDGFVSPTRGQGRLAEHVADYVLVYADGTESRQKIQRRHQVGMFRRSWGENCFQAVAHRKPYPVRPVHDQPGLLAKMPLGWGTAETRNRSGDAPPWVNWLWAWENPFPEKEIVALRFEPKGFALLVSAASAGSATSHPLRWQKRQKAILKMPEGVLFSFDLNEKGLWSQIQLDMGQVISAQFRQQYPDARWADTYNNQLPEVLRSETHIEFAAHPDARFYLQDGSTIPVAALASGAGKPVLTSVAPADKRVTFRFLDKASKKPVSVKLHVHGESGEYLPPLDRHRQPNGAWFEDYCAEFQHMGRHRTVYVPGETVVDLPQGKVFVEISKGFEIRPIRKVVPVTAETETITFEIDKVLPWRERGWVTADTHVHFLSPPTAGLEGSAEGVNVVNLLASQWGELMTNAGDFDGKTTFGSREAGGDGEWLVRVGTENRQHVMGHISLLGYKGNVIVPMCVGGADESAIGDPVEMLMLEWAERCRAQGGLVVLPHFPNPRTENAADIVSGAIDAIEMTSWAALYRGIDPYSLSDYYRYLNCGYFLSAVGGTDKMNANTAVGTIRTYAKIPKEKEFTYENWIETVRSGNTFVTYGPLLEFAVEGKPAGSRIKMGALGGTVDVSWELASVTVPMSRVELIVNGEIVQSQAVSADQASGHWTVPVRRSSWMALLVRGHYADKTEMIAAHSSPVMIDVSGSRFYSAADAVTILEQVEGALAFLDTVGTRAEEQVYKRMRIRLVSAYRQLHNELHTQGHFHQHTSITEHES
ncbi:MAG: CehA/McbA family metallohydrolase [Acidobacteriota bacterium]